MTGKRPPKIVNRTKLLTESEGFNISSVLAGTMFEIKTRSGSTYTLVVSKPEKHEVVLVGERKSVRVPTLFHLQGSTVGGSTIRAGFIGKGLNMRLSGPGSLLTTSPVVDYREVKDLNRALELLADAETRRPQQVTKEHIAEFDKIIESVIQLLPPEDQDRARNFINEFNVEGQGMMVQILRLAHEAKKLNLAFEVLDRHWREHWARRAPEIRGSFISEIDVHYIQRAYKEIGLKLPPT